MLWSSDGGGEKLVWVGATPNGGYMDGTSGATPPGHSGAYS